jgi:hypothetical protein
MPMNYRNSSKLDFTWKVAVGIARSVLMIGVAIVPWTAGRAETPAANAPVSVTAEEIARWVRELDSDRYIERRQATERLIAAGAVTIPPVLQAVQEGSLETVARGLHILSELASSSDYATECAACEALESLSTKGTVIARRASSILASIGLVRYERAKAYLTNKGAIIGAANVFFSNRTRQALPSITFNESWSGSLEDLHRLRWLVEFHHENAFEQVSWLISFEGLKITDEWLEQIKGLENVTAIKIRKTRVSEAGIARLKDLKRLRFLDILYNPLPNSAIAHLAQLPPSIRMRLYGTNLDQAAIEELRTNRQDADIDDRRGGFLGVGCDLKPCRIILVGPGTAAERAGLQVEDEIVSYNGQPVDSFDALTGLIGKNQPGDDVTVGLIRMGKPISVTVKLGECWE